MVKWPNFIIVSKVTVLISMTYRAKSLTIPSLSTASKEKLQSQNNHYNDIFHISPSKYFDNKHHYPERTLIIKCASFIFNIIRNIT